MKDIRKSFGENDVLVGAGIEVEPGEIHALMGENGAGKSTLMNILTGVHKKDSGSILIDGIETQFDGPKQAEEQGISFIHQELNTIPYMTVEENLFLNKEKTSGFFLNKKEMRNQSIEVMAKLGITIEPNTLINELSVGEQQLIEICKALMSEAKTIIMDEPTAALTDKESQVLFEIINQLKESGVSIIYISHRMEEIFKITDRITVMRDGQYIGTKVTKETSEPELVKMMIGRELTQRFPERHADIGDVIFEVAHLSDDALLNDISFDLRAGEVLGFSGLMGSGRSEIMHAIFGNRKIKNGTFTLEGEKLNIHAPKQAIEYGIAFVTEDRKDEGLMLDKSIRENISLTNLVELSKNAIMNSKAEKQVSDASVDMFKIRTFDIETLTGNLSGGNQQKVVIAKWVLSNPKVLILDEPTRGVDIGAKEEIYKIINDLTTQGIGIIMVSSDLPEVLGMSDRIAVMHEGKINGIIDASKATQESVMTLATGGVLNGVD